MLAIKITGCERIFGTDIEYCMLAMSWKKTAVGSVKMVQVIDVPAIWRKSYHRQIMLFLRSVTLPTAVSMVIMFGLRIFYWREVLMWK